MAFKAENPVYSFWNGKNLNGKQQVPDMEGVNCADCHFRCVEGTETVSVDDL